MAGKLDLKSMLIEKGEKIALLIAGGVMLLFSVIGLSLFTGTEDPEVIARDLVSTAKNVETRISDPNVEAPAIVIPAVDKSYVSLMKYSANAPYFDPIAQPETKRYNPLVLAPVEFQVDMVHAKVRSYDIVDGPPQMIGFAVPIKADAKDKKPDLSKWKKEYGKRFRGNRPVAQANPQMQGPMGNGPPSSSNPFGSGPMTKTPPGMNPMGAGMMPGGSGFDSNAQRSEIVYVRLDDEIEKKAPAGARLAETILPARVVVVSAAFPYRAQLEAFKQALRLKSVNEVLTNPDFEPIFRGINVERRVLNAITGKEVDGGWKPFDFADYYRKTIYPRKVGDMPEDINLSYVMMPSSYQLAMPLPELVDSAYPTLKIPMIEKEIKKILDTQKIPATPTALSKKFKGDGDIFSGVDAGTEMNAYLGGGEGPMGMGRKGPPGMLLPGSASPYASMPMGKTPMSNMPPMGEGGFQFSQASQDPLEVCLIRFLDSNIQTNRIYQYRIQVKIQNPNWGFPETVQKNTMAEQEILYGPFTEVTVEVPAGNGTKREIASVKVPDEKFIYAVDFPSDKKPSREGEAMLQVQEWREQIRSEGGRKEPVGDWIIAEFPVMRGEYVGNRQLVKLPVWDSAANAYLLRDINSVFQKNPPKRDPRAPKETPKGVYMDFTNQARVVVEVEGGKVTKHLQSTPTRKVTITDESATEILIFDEDGGLRLLNTANDQQDVVRQERDKRWKDWVKLVDDATKLTTGTGQPNAFARPEDGK